MDPIDNFSQVTGSSLSIILGRFVISSQSSD